MAVVVMFADLVGFTAFNEAHGDAVATELLDGFYRTMKDSARRHGLRWIKAIGDAVLLTSDNSGTAIRAGLEAIEHMNGHDCHLGLSIGMHAGDIVEIGDDVFGRTVNLAARLADEAEADQILVTKEVLGLDRLPRRIRPVLLGPRQLRNFPAPVELFAISPGRRDDKAVDPVCRRRMCTQRAVGPVALGPATYYFCSTGCLESFVGSPSSFEAVPA